MTQRIRPQRLAAETLIRGCTLALHRHSRLCEDNSRAKTTGSAVDSPSSTMSVPRLVAGWGHDGSFLPADWGPSLKVTSLNAALTAFEWQMGEVAFAAPHGLGPCRLCVQRGSSAQHPQMAGPCVSPQGPVTCDPTLELEGNSGSSHQPHFETGGGQGCPRREAQGHRIGPIGLAPSLRILTVLISSHFQDYVTIQLTQLD